MTVLLNVNAGRHFEFKIQQEERISPFCKNGVEDEIHFVMKCTQFEELRAKMLQLGENKYVAFKRLNDEQKLYLFTNEDKEVCRGISKFTFEGFKQREKIVKPMTGK